MMLSVFMVSLTCITFLVVSLISSSSGENITKCPNWYYYSNSSGRCECGYWLSCVLPHTARLMEGFCATTANEEPVKFYIGDCPYSLLGNRSGNDLNRRLYTEMPDPCTLDEAMCGQYNRKGLLCGECKKGFGPALDKVNLNCVKCSKNSLLNAVLLYVAFELVPLTLIFICFILFRLDVTAGPLFGYFIYWQITGLLIYKRYYFIIDYIKSHSSSFYHILLDVEVILSKVLTLNFLFVPFCVSEKLTGIHIQMIYLISAIYPVFLVIITCILMELHGSNFRVICILWKPFGFILNKINISAGTGDAVIHAFASFIFLSYFTVYLAMENVLSRGTVRRIFANEKFHVIYNDPTIFWLSKEHILFVAIAAIPFTIVTLLPSLLLTIYPTRIYNRWLSHCISARKRLAVTAFTEALNKCFKDGLNGTRDYRLVPGIMLSIPVAFMIFNIHILKIFSDSGIMGIVFFITLTVFVSYIKPCKSRIANFSFSFHLFLLTMLSVWYHLWVTVPYYGTEWLIKCFIFIDIIPNVLIIMWIGYVIIHRLLKHFGYQPSPVVYRMVLTDITSGVKKLFHNRQSGYLPLN